MSLSIDLKVNHGLYLCRREERRSPLSNIHSRFIDGNMIDRWIHVPSGRIYHLTYNPPKVPFKDDITGEALTKRQDDDPTTIRFRLKQYYESISPILQYYRTAGILSNVQGETSDAIYPIIKEHVAHILNKEMKL
jgi:adenylate kinase family enzyme